MSFANSRRPSRDSDEPRAPRRAKARLSLKMRAIGFLSRREHSRQELRTKLLDALRKRDREDAALDAPPPPPDAALSNPPDDDLQVTDPEAAVDQLLDWLTANKYLDETRFVESRVNDRSRKQGTLRIKLELSRHGLALDPDQAAALRETEFARAQALWQRKFGTLAADARERGKQARFLVARGFASDVVRRIVGGLDES